MHVEETGPVFDSESSFPTAARHSLRPRVLWTAGAEEVGADVGAVAPGADPVGSESSPSLWREKSAFQTRALEEKKVGTVT